MQANNGESSPPSHDATRSSTPWPEEEIHLTDYLYVLLRHKWLLLGCFFSVVVAAGGYAILATPIYEAEALLYVREDKNRVNLLSDLSYSGDSHAQAEIELIKSRTIAEDTVRKLNLTLRIEQSNPHARLTLKTFEPSDTESGYKLTVLGPDRFTLKKEGNGEEITLDVGEELDTPDLKLQVEEINAKSADTFTLRLIPEYAAVGALRGNLSVSEKGKNTGLIDLRYTDSQPQRASEVANAVLQAYLQRTVNYKTLEASRSLDFIGEQLQAVRDDLDGAEQELESYKNSIGLVQLESEAQKVVTRVVETENSLAIQNLRRFQLQYAIDALNQAIERGEKYIPAMLIDDQIASELGKKLTELELEKQALLLEYTPRNRAVKALKSRISDLHHKLLSTYQGLLSEVEQKCASLQKQIDAYQKDLKKLPEVERKLAQLMRKTEVNADIYTFLLKKHEESRILKASTISNAQIIDPAISPRKPIKPNKKKIVLLGIIVGLMTGVGAAFFREYMDDSLKDPEQIKRTLELPILATIPWQGRRNNEAETLITRHEATSNGAEAFRMLRTNIHFSPRVSEQKIIMVTSSNPGEGKSTVASNLSVSMAQVGKKVLLIGCDMRKPSLHKIFQESSAYGLSDVLREEVNICEVLNPVGNLPLKYIGSGSYTLNPAELLQSHNMEKLLTDQLDNYDHIILDSPPIALVTDAVVLSRLADMVVLIFEVGRIKRKAANMLQDQLLNLQAPVAGIVLNDKNARGEKYSAGYGYYQGYSYYRGYSYYGEADAPKRSKLMARLKG